jgi:phytoene desaturase
VTRIETGAGRAHAVRTADGERIAADAVVLAADLPTAARDLLGRKPRTLRLAPSCVLLHVGGTARYGRIAHHNIHFGRAWRRTFDEVIGGSLMSDPSLLVTNPTRTDPALAPPGRQAYFVLAPTPNLEADIDWSVIGPRYEAELLATLHKRGYTGFADGIEVRRLVTPADWRAAGLTAGTPFAAAHTFGQTGPFRPANLLRGFDNVVLAGAWTHPGVGVPMVLLSGRLAAERITG